MPIHDAISFVAENGFPRHRDEAPQDYLQRAAAYANDNGMPIDTIQSAIRQLLEGERRGNHVQTFGRNLAQVALPVTVEIKPVSALDDADTPAAAQKVTRRSPRVKAATPETVVPTDDGFEEIEPVEFRDPDETEAVLQHVRMTGDVVGDYLRSIGQFPLLNAEQEVELAKDIEAGLMADAVLQESVDFSEPFSEERDALLREIVHRGKTAKERFMESNLRLVVSIARRYTRSSGMDMIDIIQEGNLGLVRAVEKFDYQKGYKFSTYATWWIRQAITRSIPDKSTIIRIPVHMHEKVNSARKADIELTNQLGRKPTVGEVADHLGITPEEAQDRLDLARPIVYYDTPIGDGDTTMMDLLSDGSNSSDRMDDDYIRTHAGEMLHRIMYSVLDEKELHIIRRRMEGGEANTLDKIGIEVGVTRERIRQIEKKAKVKIKQAIENTPGMRDLLEEFIA